MLNLEYIITFLVYTHHLCCGLVPNPALRPLEEVGRHVNCLRDSCRRNAVNLQSPNVTLIERGSRNTENYSVYFWSNNGPVSPFHDIPLFASMENGIVNMVVEVPRWTNAKMEIMTKDPLNPIRQDVKHGNIRYVSNCFPHHGYIWNYGALPQTWENPNHKDPATGLQGDNDPIDVCEIGTRVAEIGDVIQVKVLGALALMDEGETDWKLIAIDINDQKAPMLNDIQDVFTHFPGLLESTVHWFKVYKIPTGSAMNRFAFNDKPMDSAFAYQLINATHQQWKGLIAGTSNRGKISIKSTVLPEATEKMTRDEAMQIIMKTPKWKPPSKIDPKANKWFFIDQQGNMIRDSAR